MLSFCLSQTESSFYKEIKRAIKKGVAFLQKAQQADGSFLDFNTAAGPSDEWITAHVCWLLGKLPSMKDTHVRAFRFLLGENEDRFSWGYNRTVASDCDATSQVMMALNSLQYRIPKKTLSWVLLHQHRNGGFGTYAFSKQSPFNSWSLPHHETTLDVLAAIRVYPSAKAAVLMASNWIRNQAETAPLKAFWWDNPAYILWTQKRLGMNAVFAKKTGALLLPAYQNHVPNLPLLLSGLKLDIFDKKSRIFNAIKSLLSKQDQDGSWECEPCLRVSNRMNYHVNLDDGALYRGQNRIFSTAHSLSALYLFERQITSSFAKKGLLL